MTSARPLESVWDYPTPPRVERTDELVVIEHAGVEVARTQSALRVLETSHPPTYYLPREAFTAGVLQPAASGRTTTCEFKGVATYHDLLLPGGAPVVRDAGWSYPSPRRGFQTLRGRVAVYPGRVERVTVDGEVVTAQEGDFYGGWITARITGPFKGGPGSWGW